MGEGDHLHFNYFTTATAPLQPPLSRGGYILENPPPNDSIAQHLLALRDCRALIARPDSCLADFGSPV